MLVEASVRGQGISVRGGTLDDLALRHYTSTAVSLA